MVIVQIRGGLGNQMFQYAAGRALAQARGDILKMDLSRISRDPLRQYALGCFCLPQEFATRSELWSAARMGVGSRADVVIRRVWQSTNAFPRGYLRERSEFVYDPDLLHVDAKHVYMVGFWQNERYFANVKDRVRRDFEVGGSPDATNAVTLSSIIATESVFLHVRRGDYVSNPRTFAAHGLCSLEYYQGAIAFLLQRVHAPHFFVFSDDIPWVRENLAIEHPVTWVDHNGPDSPCEDLRLMRACKHAIIANSSFSWWGAWLIANPDRTVIAPSRWMNDQSRDTSDLLPRSWVRLDDQRTPVL